MNGQDSDGNATGTTLFSAALPLNQNPGTLDLDQIRRRFAELFDQSVRAVSRAGYDLDDVVVHRYLDCRTAGTKLRGVTAEALSDRQRLWDHVVRELRSNGAEELDDRHVEIVNVRVVTVLDRHVSSQHSL